MRKILFIVLVVLLIASCKNKPVEFKETSLVLKDSTEICVINNKIPVLSDLSGKYGELCDKINIEIKNKSNERLINFRKDAYDFYKEFIKDASEPSALLYSYEGSYDKFCSDEKTISFRSIYYIYTGGAHGITQYDCYNFDVKTGKSLKFEDVFKTDEKSISKINALLIEYFKNPDNCFTTNPSINREFVLFTIQKDTILFTFLHYELGAYSCGSAEVEIPVLVLKEAGVYRR